MNTSNTIYQSGGHRWKLLAGILAAGILVGGLTACRTTHQVSIDPKDFSGFLGDYSLLHKGTGNQADYLYIDKNANWAKYTKIYIENVDLWKSDDPDSAVGKMPPETQQMLVNFFHTVLVDSLKKDFEIVDKPGPDTIVLRVAITDPRKSWPVLNLVSSVVPMAIVLSYAKQAITGSGTGVGGLRVEAKATDGQSGQLLCEGVDERVGTKALRTKFDGTWGDAKLCMEWWANRWLKAAEELKKGDTDPK